MMMTKEVKCGLYVHYASNLQNDIQKATNSGYQFIATHLIHPRSRGFTPHSDLQLSSVDWSTLVIGIVSNYDLEQNPLENTKKIDAEISYSMHLGLHALLFESPANADAITLLAHLINSKVILSNGYQNLPQFWIQISVNSTINSANVWRNDIDADHEHEAEDSWHRWNQIRNQIAPDKRVAIALELTGDLPDPLAMDRWAGEPVKAIIVPTSLFLTNRKNYPVLSRAHQIFIRTIIDKTARDVHFIIKGNNRHDDIRFYSQYIDHIKSAHIPMDTISSFAKGYEDYLQMPLQPLMDNLESCTYEVFEKDPVKYDEYGKAILEAMKTIQRDKDIVVMVLGAGRGPLIRATLRAAVSCNKYVHIYAVEKNPNAVVTLNALSQTQWGFTNGIANNGTVEVIACDMRQWDAPEKADIVVSELLGSFGDNELSPECLDGVWSYVKEDAISIPSSYTSYLSPIQSQRLYCEASLFRERDKPAYAPYETGYVVHIRNCYPIGEPQELFTFEHTDLIKKPLERDNSRFSVLHFKAQIDTICHGFAGYFETTLYGDIKLSTVPATHTPGMISWFPMYFPINPPINIKKGDTVVVNFWRMVNKRQVWYEWCISKPSFSSIHNPNGRTYSIGLY